ncbi:MAG: Lrp/AsnC ligand binding domain-containing protein [Gammaproteobacteria bacterium]|nr:Lrp/AsnC ligand binding domain-containing protein [Gammaproteobacteria bacterium]
MITAIVLINAAHGKVGRVAETLADMPEVSEAYSVGGNYDVIAILRVRTNEDIAALVTERMAVMDGIERTETLIAFRTYSRHDLESIFSM